MIIRTADAADLAAIAAVEAACFPRRRGRHGGGLCRPAGGLPQPLLAVGGGWNADLSFIDGMVTDEPFLGTKCTKTPPCTMRAARGR